MTFKVGDRFRDRESPKRTITIKSINGDEVFYRLDSHPTGLGVGLSFHMDITLLEEWYEPIYTVEGFEV